MKFLFVVLLLASCSSQVRTPRHVPNGTIICNQATNECEIIRVERVGR